LLTVRIENLEFGGFSVLAGPLWRFLGAVKALKRETGRKRRMSGGVIPSRGAASKEVRSGDRDLHSLDALGPLNYAYWTCCGLDDVDSRH
jgi:hypothetical protein